VDVCGLQGWLVRDEFITFASFVKVSATYTSTKNIKKLHFVAIVEKKATFVQLFRLKNCRRYILGYKSKMSMMQTVNERQKFINQQ
jgi:hypothetical protein